MEVGVCISQQAGEERLCLCRLLIEVDEDEGMGGDEHTQWKKGEDESVCVYCSDEDGGDDECPEGHEEEG